MAKQIKLVQQRPNTGVAFFDASDEFKNLKVTYVNDGAVEDQNKEEVGAEVELRENADAQSSLGRKYQKTLLN